VSFNLHEFAKVFESDKPSFGTFLLEVLVGFWELNIPEARVEFIEGQFILWQ